MKTKRKKYTKNQIKVWKMVAKLRGWDVPQNKPKHCTVWGMLVLYSHSDKEIFTLNWERFEEHAEQCQYCFLMRINNAN